MTEQDITRFVGKLQDTGGCIVWTGAVNSNGYGVFRAGTVTAGDRRLVLAHRFAYEAFVAPVPKGFELDHECCNRVCVNPQHLEVVTHQVNCERRNARRAA
jgi:hypothetical protein